MALVNELMDLLRKAEPEPKDMAWTNYHQAVNTEIGGKIHIGGGKFVDAEGNPLDLETRGPELDAEIARLEARKKTLEDQKAKLPKSEEVKTEDKEQPNPNAGKVESVVEEPVLVAPSGKSK